MICRCTWCARFHLDTLTQAMSIRRDPPSPGAYDLGGTRLHLRRRPHRLARWLVRLLLDWRWIDA